MRTMNRSLSCPGPSTVVNSPATNSVAQQLLTVAYRFRHLCSRQFFRDSSSRFVCGPYALFSHQQRPRQIRSPGPPGGRFQQLWASPRAGKPDGRLRLYCGSKYSRVVSTPLHRAAAGSLRTIYKKRLFSSSRPSTQLSWTVPTGSITSHTPLINPAPRVRVIHSHVVGRARR